MYPHLFTGTPYEIATWNFFFGIGMIVQFILIFFIIKPKDFRLSRKIYIIAYLAFITLCPLGGRIASLLLHLPAFIKGEWPSTLLSSPNASLGGLFFGIGIALICTKVFLKDKDIGYLRILDHMIPLAYLQLAFVRIGCFCNGCCYGTYTDLPWGCTFFSLSSPRHPTQLYSFIVLVFVLIVTLKIYRKNFPPGTAFFSSLAMYSFFRFFIELLRNVSFEINGIRCSPIFMLGLFIFSLIALIVNFKNKPRQKIIS